jgi:hypothetical protein
MNAQTLSSVDATVTAVAAAPRSLQERLEAARALVAKYEAQINSEAQINNVQVGDDVSFTFGRADRARILTGVVSAVADTDTGRMAAVTVGSGLDVEIKKIRAADITENRTAATRIAPEAAAEAVSADAAGGDPLNAE